MKLGIRHEMESPAGQIIAKPGPINTAPGGSRDLNLVRHRTTDFELWGVVQERPTSLTFFAPGITHGLILEGSRPKSEMDLMPDPRQDMIKNRIPILGPTRQQTDLYLKKMARQKKGGKRQPVIPIDGPTKQLTTGGRLVPGDIAIFEDQAANAVLFDAENQLKSGYPTIATSSMVARRNKPNILDDIENQTDMKFFSELVKPVEYRWKFQKDKLKTMTPSKHGFHQRSQSPTFQRLVGANEKLQHLVGHDTDSGINSMGDFFDTQSEVTPASTMRPHLRFIRTEPNSVRTSMTGGSLPATKEVFTIGRFDIKPDIRTIEPSKREAEDNGYEDDDGDDYSLTRSPTPTTPPLLIPPSQPLTNKKLQQDFKVDFKRLDSHSELHLFLPHIHENTTSRGATPDTPTRKDSVQLSLPRIEDTADIKLPEDKSKNKKRHKNIEPKKKKKPATRVKSGKDEKEIRDRLNDVPTWISLENEKNYHPASMCMFENCALHQHRKSTKIRQA